MQTPGRIVSCKADFKHGPWSPPLLIISKTSAHEATVQFIALGFSCITNNNREFTSLDLSVKTNVGIPAMMTISRNKQTVVTQAHFGTNTEWWVSGLKPISVRYWKRIFSKATGGVVGIAPVVLNFIKHGKLYNSQLQMLKHKSLKCHSLWC